MNILDTIIFDDQANFAGLGEPDEVQCYHLDGTPCEITGE